MLALEGEKLSSAEGACFHARIVISRAQRFLVVATLAAAMALPGGSAMAAPAAKEPAEGAYAEAKAARAALEKDQKRRKYRDQWLAVVKRFEAVAAKYPKSKRAPDALYNVAGLYAELARVSLARRDLERSVEVYQELCKRYPKSSLADDARLALARIHRDRLGDLERARVEYQAAIKLNGDMASAAKREMAELKATAAAPKEREESKERQASRAEPAKPDSSKLEVGRPSPAKAEPTKSASAKRDPDERDERPDPPKAAQSEARARQIASAARGAALPVSVQLGLKLNRIVIDPGHGGHDPGAIGPGGTKEKDVALAIARKLAARLEEAGFEALLTRDQDEFISLEDRARYANRSKGDLFVSIHCNASKKRAARGVEVYTLNVTSDRYAIRLAARENAASERTVSDLQFILADLAAKANTDESSNLARSIQNRLLAVDYGKDQPRDLGVKQALFYVLLGAKMPSVLVETDFISNPDEEKRLASSAHQSRVAEALAEGIVRFASDRTMLANLD